MMAFSRGHGDIYFLRRNNNVQRTFINPEKQIVSYEMRYTISKFSKSDPWNKIIKGLK